MSLLPTVYTKLLDYGETEINYLKSVDDALGVAITRLGKLDRVIMPDLYAALVYAIVGQLISAKAAHTIWERMQERLGEISPSNMAKHTADQIQSCGITMKKAVCIKSIAESITRGEIQLEELNGLSDAEVIKRLIILKGIGKWTAEMLLIHAMERPDVVSWGDIAIRRGMMKLYGLDALTIEQFEQYRLRYSPHGSVASIYLWALSKE